MKCVSPGSLLRSGSRAAVIAGMALLVLLLDWSAAPLRAQQVRPSESGCVALGLFVRNDCENCAAVREQVAALTANLPGVQLREFNLDEPGPHVDRYQQI